MRKPKAYLFVFLVTTLDNSRGYFLLLSEGPPLLGNRAQWVRGHTEHALGCKSSLFKSS